MYLESLQDITRFYKVSIV